ncbi:MAG: hypothetical protein OSB26_02175 [Woeseiaceae bacterium]|nr:hypothetical protein [Woeseiaceae bacterium]
MKYLISLLVGTLLGATLFLLGLYYNPFVGQASVSPLAVSDTPVIDLIYSAVPGESILYTNNGESTIAPFPDRVGELWEPAIVDTSAWVTELRSSRGEWVGIGIKFSSPSEQTRIVHGEAMANSVWHIYLPEKGTFLIDQTENYWTYLRDVVIPAYWSSSDNWRGTYHSIMTNGPGSLGTARLTCGSGMYADLISEAVESRTARGYSSTVGPISMSGSLSVAISNTEVVNAE